MKKLTALFVFTCMCVSIAWAQEPQPEKYADQSIYRIQYVKFHPGKMNRAKELISTYFRPAAEQAESDMPMMNLDLMSGEWDMISIWKNDLSDLAWKTSANGLKWWSAMVSIAGSEDKANEIWSEYQGLIARSSSDMARIMEM